MLCPPPPLTVRDVENHSRNSECTQRWVPRPPGLIVNPGQLYYGAIFDLSQGDQDSGCAVTPERQTDNDTAYSVLSTQGRSDDNEAARPHLMGRRLVGAYQGPPDPFLRYGPPTEKFANRYALAHHHLR